jgi:hypothetical protein
LLPARFQAAFKFGMKNNKERVASINGAVGRVNDVVFQAA